MEACENALLTNLLVEIEGGTTVAGNYGSGDSYYAFKVSEGTSGVPLFSWNEVTAEDVSWETDEGAIETVRMESKGPSRGLPELLAEYEAGSDLYNYAREAAIALIGLYDIAQDVINECAEEAAYQASLDAAGRLSRRFREPYQAPDLPCVETDLAAFQEACRERAQHCDGIVMAWDENFDRPPQVEFGIFVNTPQQILYKIDPDKDLYLNGFWTRKSRLEEDLLQQFPTDGWARLGARNAALDLIKIQDSAQALMDAQKQDTLQDLDRRYVEDRFKSVEGTLRGRASSDHQAGVDFACEALWEKIKAHLYGLRRHPLIRDDEYDFGDLEFDLAEDSEAGENGEAGLVNS